MDADFVFEVEELLFDHKRVCRYYERLGLPATAELTSALNRHIASAEDALYGEDEDALDSVLEKIGHTLEALKRKTYGQ